MLMYANVRAAHLGEITSQVLEVGYTNEREHVSVVFHDCGLPHST